MIAKDCKRYCREDLSLVKNYNLAIADIKHRWDCHHINELTFTKKELIKMNMYYNRPASELIFLRRSEHFKLHYNLCSNGKTWKENLSNGCTGRIFTEETKKKLSISKTGKKHTIDTKIKISNSHKGKQFSDEHRKNLSKSLKGIIPWNKGLKIKRKK